ncbi:MAG: peptidoglycan D,D-transpeptidase FtsI family protein [Gammaproteobacteria bacterium]
MKWGLTPRGNVMVGLFLSAAALLSARALYLQWVETEVLQHRGARLHVRVVELPTHRGMITDRRGEPLAISTPIDTAAAAPAELLQARERLPEVAQVLDIDTERLSGILTTRQGREFTFLKRHLPPSVSERLSALAVPGVVLRREYRRYYPASESTAHLIGFTDIDDIGQEGLERAFDDTLRGIPGKKRVIKDNRGRVVENIEVTASGRPGRDLVLSIDKRVQHVAYRGLKSAVHRYRARAGSVVVMDAGTGEVLAAVNRPSYNPNDRRQIKGEYYRNRAFTDVFEPGSTLKPFAIAAALEAGACQPSTVIDTRPGVLRVGRRTIRDIHDYGLLDVAGVIEKSSNVGTAKLVLPLGTEVLWRALIRLRFGRSPDSGFPGEAQGSLPHHRNWREIDHATMAFGYGLSVSAVQLASAYTALANGGVVMPAGIVRLDAPPAATRVISRTVADQIRRMLEGVVTGGTGTRAQVPGYRVAGKTGTVHKTSSGGGYSKDRYLALFAGMIPASRPRLVTVVVIDEPRNGVYFGGEVAAPVFSNIMSEAVRLLDITPDDLPPPRVPAPAAGVRPVRLDSRGTL